MSNSLAEVQQTLTTEDPEFRQWVEEHHRCEDRLNQLISKGQITAEEEIEEKQLKKRKLHLKDQMAQRMRTFDHEHVA